jgi:hypothetical protein
MPVLDAGFYGLSDLLTSVRGETPEMFGDARLATEADLDVRRGNRWEPNAADSSISGVTVEGW